MQQLPRKQLQKKRKKIKILATIEKGDDIVVTCCVVQNICIQQGDLFYGEKIGENVLHCNVNLAQFGRGVGDNLTERKRQLICDSVNTRRPVIAFRRTRL